MNYLFATLQLVGVGLGAFALFALLLSYVRYRKMQLQAADHAEGELSVTEAVLLILAELRRHRKQGQMGLIRVSVSPEPPGKDLKDFLRQHLRKDDFIFRLDRSRCVILAPCPNENLPALRGRLHQLLMQEGYQTGHLGMTVPELNVQTLCDWIVDEAQEAPPGSWLLYPEEWPYQAEEVTPSVSMDGLTGVLKADRVPRALRRKLASFRRSGRKISLVSVDVDQLASYNQSHGREIGDLILKTVADHLMENCRETDLIGRLEDDAFVLAIEGEADDVLSALRRMSELIKQTPLRIGENEIRFSAGFGLASMPADGRNPIQLMTNAKLAMEEAKKRGRGVCVAFQASMKAPVSHKPGAATQTETF